MGREKGGDWGRERRKKSGEIGVGCRLQGLQRGKHAGGEQCTGARVRKEGGKAREFRTRGRTGFGGGKRQKEGNRVHARYVFRTDQNAAFC